MSTLLFLLILLASGRPTSANLDDLMVPGDVIRLEFPRDPKLSGLHTVGEEGMLVLPLGAPLRIEGTEAKAVPARIRAHIAPYFVGIEDLDVTIARKMIRCKAMGNVGTPGWKSLPVGSDVQDLLREAQGMKDGAQMNKVLLSNIHLKGDPETFDMTRYLQADAGKGARTLRNGDVLFVPLSPVMGDIQRTLMPYVAPPAEGRRNVVNVIGEVANPGVYEVNGEVNVLDLIAMAGGPTTPRNSALVLDLENIRVIRQEGRRPVTRTFNLSKFFETGDPALLLPLRAGDNVLVPAKKVDVEDKTKVVSVTGAVAQPVTWELSGPTSIVQILARSGGFARERGELLADPSRILVVTTDSVAETLVRYWDWNAWEADPTANPPLVLRSADVVVVPWLDPERRNGPVQRATATVLGAVRAPGLVPVGPESDLLQVLALAGGLDMVDGEARAILVREVDGRTTRSVFPVRDYFVRPDAGQVPVVVPAVRPGDRIWVERRRSREWAWWIENGYRAALSVGVVAALWAGASP